MEQKEPSGVPNLRDANMTPDLENAINQIQELWQKKYADTPAEYEFGKNRDNTWSCDCTFCGIHPGFPRNYNVVST